MRAASPLARRGPATVPSLLLVAAVLTQITELPIRWTFFFAEYVALVVLFVSADRVARVFVFVAVVRALIAPRLAVVRGSANGLAAAAAAACFLPDVACGYHHYHFAVMCQRRLQIQVNPQSSLDSSPSQRSVSFPASARLYDGVKSLKTVIDAKLAENLVRLRWYLWVAKHPRKLLTEVRENLF